jgi:hypothetical protein
MSLNAENSNRHTGAHVPSSIESLSKQVQSSIKSQGKFSTFSQENLQGLHEKLKLLSEKLQNSVQNSTLTKEERDQVIETYQIVNAAVIDPERKPSLVEKAQNVGNKHLLSLSKITQEIEQTLSEPSNFLSLAEDRVSSCSTTTTSAEDSPSDLSRLSDSSTSNTSASFDSIEEPSSPTFASNISTSSNNKAAETSEENLKKFIEDPLEQVGSPGAPGMHKLFTQMIGNQKFEVKSEGRIHSEVSINATQKKPISKEAIAALLKAMGYNSIITTLATQLCTEIEVFFPKVLFVQKGTDSIASLVFPSREKAIIFTNVPDPYTRPKKTSMFNLPKLQRIDIGISEIFYKDGKISVELRHINKESKQWGEVWDTADLGSVTGEALNFWKAVHGQSKK